MADDELVALIADAFHVANWGGPISMASEGTASACRMEARTAVTTIKANPEVVLRAIGGEVCDIDCSEHYDGKHASFLKRLEV